MPSEIGLCPKCGSDNTEQCPRCDACWCYDCDHLGKIKEFNKVNKMVWLKKLVEEYGKILFETYSDPTYGYENQAPIIAFWEWVQSSQVRGTKKRMIYLTREEIFEEEILPWIKERQEGTFGIHHYGVRREVMYRLPPLPDGVVIEDLDEVIGLLLDTNKKLQEYSKDTNTRYTRNTLTENEVGWVSTMIYKGNIFSKIPKRLIELYGPPIRRTFALTLDDEWIEVRNWPKNRGSAPTMIEVKEDE